MHLCQTINLKHWHEWKTYSLIRCSSNKGKELSQQHTVCWLVSAVLYGQRLQQGKWAAAMTSRVVSPSEDKGLQIQSNTLYSYKLLAFLLSNTDRRIPLWRMCKLQVLVSNHLQVRRCRHATQEDWLLHHGDHRLGIRHRLRSWEKTEEELGENQTLTVTDV